MITIKQMSKNFQIKNKTVTVLNQIDLEIEEGLTYIVGASGSGKSTILNILGGIDRVSAGEIHYDGINVTNFNEKQWAEFRNQKIGFVFQNFNLLPHLTAIENIELSLQIAGADRKVQREQALSLLEKVGMTEHGKKKPNELSGGQKQRVAIARALSNQPDIILADEPTGALDSENSREVMMLLKQISQEGGKTVIVITHSQSFNELADEIVTIKDGKIKDVRRLKKVEEERLYEKYVEKQAPFLSLISTLKLSSRNLKKTKTRTFFSAWGASVGIFGILLISFLVTGLNNELNKRVSSRSGDETLLISKNDGQLMPTSYQEQLEKISTVEEVVLTNRFDVQMTYQDKIARSTGTNLTVDTKKMIKNYAQLGKAPLTKNEVAISEKIALELFGKEEEALGKEVKLDAQLLPSKIGDIFPVEQLDVIVTGIFTSQKNHLAEVEFPYETAIELMDKNSVTRGKTSLFTIVPKKANDLDAIQKVIEKQGFSVEANSMATVKKYLSLAKTVIASLAAISLIVATILICVVLYIGVAEREKEIGIMKALGSTPGAIQKLFLVEGSIIGLLGGAIGLVSAVGTSIVVNSLIQTFVKTIHFNFFKFDYGLITAIMLGSIFLGLLAAYFPAKMASSKKTIDVLRYD